MESQPLVEEFLRHLSAERGLSPNTCAAYASDLAHFLSWLGKRDPFKADSKALDDYLWHLKADKELEASSVFRKQEALRAFYKFQAAEERLVEDPTRRFRAPRLPKRLPKYLTVEEALALLRVPEAGSFSTLRTKTAIELLYATGMRASELLALRPDYVNLQEGWVRVMGKGSKERMIPLHRKARERLSAYLSAREGAFRGRSSDPQIFLNRSGKSLSRVQLWRDLRALGRRAGLSRELHPHLLRHTFASHLLQGGADLRVVQEMLGHADLSSTQIYTHLDPSGLKEAHRKYHPRG